VEYHGLLSPRSSAPSSPAEATTADAAETAMKSRLFINATVLLLLLLVSGFKLLANSQASEQDEYY
jgi:hypothetical protein